MKNLRLIFIFLLLTVPVAAYGKGSGMGRFSIFGYYGMAFIDPKEVNDTSSVVFVSPAYDKNKSASIFGGGMGYMLSPKFQIRATYEQQESKKTGTYTNMFGSTVADSGAILKQEAVWLGGNWYFLNKPNFFSYLGGSVGYTLGASYNVKINTDSIYKAQTMGIGYMGQLGLGFRIGSFLLLFIEGGYQSVTTADFKKDDGTYLNKVGTSTKAKMDMSGTRAVAGLGFAF